MTNVHTLNPTPRNIRVMVDLETMGLGADALVLSIGAVEIDSEARLDNKFYIEINPNTHPGNIEIETMKFWMKQAFDGNPCPCEGIISLEDTLLNFIRWLDTLTTSNTDTFEIWTNGTDFDIPKLYYAFDEVGQEIPWKYNAVRDARTIYKLFGSKELEPAKNEDKHNALSDAIWQAKYLAHIFDDLANRGVDIP